MQLLSRGFGGLGVVVGLGVLTWACGSRTAPIEAPAPQPTSSPPVSEVASPPPLAQAPPLEMPPSADVEAVAEADCEVIVDAGAPVAIIAVTGAVDSANAPRPTNDGERLLFRQLYETLVRVDCEGRLRSGLARTWRLDDHGGSWIVTLREDARFSDGTHVTAATVVASWSRPVVEELLPEVSLHVASVVPLDERTLAITLRDGGMTPLALAHTDLAVAKRSSGSGWPLGTRSTWVAEEEVAQDSGRFPAIVLTREARNSSSPNGTESRSVRFVLAPGGDPRDLLDQGVDLLVTSDASALDYASTLPQFVSVPLAWQRTHVFLSPWGAPLSRLPTATTLQALADDAVRGEARGAEAPFWWQEPTDCKVARGHPRDANLRSTGRIVYFSGDAAARDLAERFVGLASAATSGANEMLAELVSGREGVTYERATALTREDLAMALQRGADSGYVVPLDRHQLDPCAELRGMVERAGWFDLRTIVPLIDTRQRAIVRQGRSGMTVEWDGGLLIGRPGER